MPDGLGFSVYLSTFDLQWPELSLCSHTNAPVFLSLNMGKGEADCREAERICRVLSEHGFRIIADVSTETVKLFQQPDLLTLAADLGLWALRIDYGYSGEQIRAMGEKMPIVLNASTTDPETAGRIFRNCPQVAAMHNFYPRPETGLDRDRLLSVTRRLQAAGLRVQAFIPGDLELRGPVSEGLPTLEEHRGILPSVAFADLSLTFGIDDIFVGDPGISRKEQQRIADFCKDGTLSVPAVLQEEFTDLYERTYTCRIDSPRALVRFEESRTTLRWRKALAPEPACHRPRGSITMDNVDYGPYSGEIQIIRKDLGPDRRVNVIGTIPQNAWPVMDLIRGGQKFRLVKP